MEILNIPRRTFQRYLSEAFLPERQLLSRKLTDDEVLNQLAFFEARISKQRRDLLTLADDKNTDGKTRIAAHKAASEMAALVYKAYSEAAPEVLKGRASTFSHDREEARTGHYYSTKAGGRKAAPYSAEKYERGLEELQQQEYMISSMLPKKIIAEEMPMISDKPRHRFVYQCDRCVQVFMKVSL
jgi:hypothetical protein